MFGIPAIKNFRISHPAEWLRMMNDFETKKRGRRAFDSKDTRIMIPRDFIRFVSDFSSSELSACMARSCNIRDVEVYNNEYLCLGPNAMKQLFEPVVNGIVRHMTNLFRKPALNNISCLFMVGGFAESAILQDAIQRAFGSRCKILIPNYASIAVVQGATIFGKKPDIVSSRIMATTYGFGTHEAFDSKVHPRHKMIIVEGVAKCKDIFKVVVTENDVIRVGEKKIFIQCPLYSDQKSVNIQFFTSTDPNVKYTTDATVGPLSGKLIVESPDISKGKNREIQINIYFGETEIKATAIDMTSKNTANAYFDFLCKSQTCMLPAP